MGTGNVMVIAVQENTYTIRVIDRRAKTFGDIDTLPWFPKYALPHEIPFVGKLEWVDNIDTPYGQQVSN
jgi:hypothetical protein